MTDLSVKSFIELQILEGKTPSAILRETLKNYPRAKISDSHIRFYALQLKRENVLTEIEAERYLHATVKSETEPKKRGRKPKVEAPVAETRGRPRKEKVAVEKKEKKAPKKKAVDKQLDLLTRAQKRKARKSQEEAPALT